MLSCLISSILKIKIIFNTIQELKKILSMDLENFTADNACLDIIQYTIFNYPPYTMLNKNLHSIHMHFKVILLRSVNTYVKNWFQIHRQ